MTETAVDPRTDAQIETDAGHALESRRTVPGGVKVHVERGVVTLTGRVYREFERVEAADAVAHISGVQGVVNDVVVATPAAGFDVPDDVC